LAIAFVLTASVGPLAFFAASLRAAPAALPVPSASGGLLALLAWPAIAGAVVVGTVLLLELAFDVVKLRRVKRRAAPLGTVSVRRARIGTSHTVSTPTAIGYLHPAVVVPADFRARVDDREWDAVVAHECAHLSRRDDWAKAIQSALLRAGWWLPGLWVLSRALDLERELASDEYAVDRTGPRRYAACLLRLATDRGCEELAPAFGGRRSHVAIRVERLLRPVADGGIVRRAIALGSFTAVAFGVLGIAAVMLPGTGSRPLASAVRPVRMIAHAAAPASARSSVPRRRDAAPRLAAAIRRPAVRPAAVAPAPAAPVIASRPVAAAVPVSPRTAALAFPAPKPASTRPKPSARRAESPRLPVLPPAVTPAQAVAFFAPTRHCRTCFGPLRSADDAFASQMPSLTSPAAHPSGPAVALAADDQTSGPVSLGSPMVLFRIPSRTVQIP
jgi:beta-lactamase regulating signal transducer with metallopeptidase domain